MPQSSVRWITDFEVAEAILRHKSFREVTFKGLVPLLGNVIVTQEGPAHRERREIAGRLFVPSLLKTAESGWVQTIIQDCLKNLGQEACLVEISYRVMTRLAARLIGLDNLETSERITGLVTLLSALVSGTQSQHGSRSLSRRAARDELRRSYLDGAISRRRNLLAFHQAGRISSAELPFDLITLLLLHTNQAGTGWDTRQIAGEVAFFAVAAVDTTASLVPHLLHELWKFIQQHPQSPDSYLNLDFLRAAAAEALRLHPAIPTIFREAFEPASMSGELHFETGQVAGIYVSQANRSQQIFGEDAEDFNPFRKIRPKTRRAGLSFGGGLHLCLGRELATGTPELAEPVNPGITTEDFETNQLYGQAALLALALLQKGARPNPAKPVLELSPYSRDVYKTYPILLN